MYDGNLSSFLAPRLPNRSERRAHLHRRSRNRSSTAGRPQQWIMLDSGRIKRITHSYT